MPKPRRPLQPSLFPEPGARRERPARVAPLPPLDAESSLAAGAGGFDDHLARQGKTENTRRAFMSDLRLLGRWLGMDRSLSTITTDDLRRFLSWMLEYRSRPCSAKTYARRVTTLKVFFAWLAESGVLTHDPAQVLVHRRAASPLPLVLSDAQVDALLAEARRRAKDDDSRPELLVRLLLDTGLKKGELARLRLEDLAPDAEPPTLLVRYDSQRWRSKERRVAFSPAVRPLLAAYRGRYAPQERLFECTARNLEYVLEDLVQAADLPERTGFETLRWTSALRAYRAGEDTEDLRVKLGLSPVTWAETERKLSLLSDGVGGGRGGSILPHRRT